MTDLPLTSAYVFISYSHEQLDYATRLANYLKSRGFNCWFDKTDIEPGEIWEQEIRDGVRDCAALIVLVTQESQSSKWVNNEVSYARQAGKKIFPLLLSGAEWVALSDIQYLDVRDGKMPDAAFLELLAKTAPRSEIPGKDVTPFIFERGNKAYANAETVVARTKKARAWRKILETCVFLILGIVLLLTIPVAPYSPIISFILFVKAITGINDLLTKDLPSNIRQTTMEYAFDRNSQVVRGETVSSEETIKDPGIGIRGKSVLREYSFRINYRFISPISGQEITNERSESSYRSRAEEMPLPGTPVRILFNADDKYRLL